MQAKNNYKFTPSNAIALTDIGINGANEIIGQ
jgi:hypothetical protein